MKIKVNTDVIYDLKPCSDRLDNWLLHYSEFNGDIVKFLKLKKITYNDKIWVAVRLIPLEMKVIFAIDCNFAAYYICDTAGHAVHYAAYAANAADVVSATVHYAVNAAANAAIAASAASAADCDGATNVSHSATDAVVSYVSYVGNTAEKIEQDRQIQALIYLIKGE